MDWLQKTIVATALGVALIPVGAARAQTRPNPLASGVGSTSAQPANAREKSSVFVSPQVGVAESAQPVEAYDEDRAPTPSKRAPLELYAESVELEESTAELDQPNAELAKEKLQAAEIFAKTQDRAARRKHVVRAINAPMTLGALNGKPNAQANRQVQRQTNAVAPQFQQYAPTTFQLSPGSRVVSTETENANELNWDGSSKRNGAQFGRTQSPTLQQPVVYGLMKDDAALATSGETDATTPNLAEVSSHVAQETDANAIDLENDLEDPLANPPQDSLTTIEALSPITPLENGEEEQETPTIDSLPELVTPEPQANVELDASEEQPSLETLESLDPQPEPNQPESTQPETAQPETPQPVFQNPDLTSIAPTAPESQPEIQDVPVPPIQVETQPAANDAPIAPVAPPKVAPEEKAATSAKPVETNKEQPQPATVEELTTQEGTEQAPTQESNVDEDAPTPQPPTTSHEREVLTLDLPYCSPYEYAQASLASPTVTAPPADNPAVSQLLARPYPQNASVEPTCAQPQCAPNIYAQPQYASYAPCSATTCQPATIGQSYGIPQARGNFGNIGNFGPVGFQNGLQPGYDQPTFYEYDADAPAFDAAGRAYGLLGGAEWLSWRTDSDKPYARITNDFGITHDERDLQTSGSGVRGRVGFRALSGWDIVGAYTWYDADDSGTLSANGAPLVSPFVGSQYGLDGYSEISATLKTELQTVDLEVGRWNDRGAFSFRPFAGFRWTQFNEEFTNVFSTTSTTTNGGILATTSMLDGEDDVETIFSNAVTEETATAKNTVFARSRLNAYGLRVGADVNLALTQGLSVYGKGAGTIAVGDVKSLTYLQDERNSVEVKKTYATPSLEGGVGLSWKRNGLEVRGGYEFNAWYNASYLNGRKSDFLAHGYVAGLGWNY